MKRILKLIIITVCITSIGAINTSAQDLCPGTLIPDGKINIEAVTVFDEFTGLPLGGVSLDFGAALLGIFEQKTSGPVHGGMDWFFSTLPPPGSKPGSQVVSYWTLKDNRNTKIQVTNNSLSQSVQVHFSILDENCVELRDFCDTFTAGDTHTYDLSDLITNTGLVINTSSLVNFEGVLHITATDDCFIAAPPNLPAIGFSQLSSSVTITDNTNNFDYKFNGFNRDVITSGCSTFTTGGDPILDGSANCRHVRVPVFTFGSFQIQGVNLTSSFSTTPDTVASRGDLVIINFEDTYSVSGFSEYGIGPANADITPFIFNEVEAPFSCPTFENSCVTRLGINNNITNSATALPDSDMDGVLDTDDNCPDTPNPLQADTDSDMIGDLCDDCPLDDTNTCDPAGSASEEIDPATGGTVQTGDMNLTLEIPPGSVSADTTISIMEVMPGDPEADLIIGSNTGLGEIVVVYDLQPDGQMFSPPATLTIIVDVTSLNATQRANLDMYVFNDATSSYESLGAVCTITENPPGTFIAECTVDIDHFTDFAVIAPLDTDGDGIPDDFPTGSDDCDESDLSDTVVIDGCDTGVENVLAENGCTISDDIMECADGARNHGQFVSCVAKLTNVLKKDGIISGKEKGNIQSCAAQSDLP